MKELSDIIQGLRDLSNHEIDEKYKEYLNSIPTDKIDYIFLEITRTIININKEIGINTGIIKNINKVLNNISYDSINYDYSQEKDARLNKEQLIDQNQILYKRLYNYRYMTEILANRYTQSYSKIRK